MRNQFRAVGNQFLFRIGPVERAEVVEGAIADSVSDSKLLGIGIRPEDRDEDNSKDQKDDEDSRDHSHRVLAEPLHGIMEESSRFTEDVLLFLFFLRGREETGIVDLEGERVILEIANHVPASFLVQLDLRIKDLVKDIGKEEHEDHDVGEEYSCTHDEGIIPIRNRLDEFPADSRDGEDLFDNEGASDDISEFRSDISQDRRKGIPKGMLEEDFRIG